MAQEHTPLARSGRPWLPVLLLALLASTPLAAAAPDPTPTRSPEVERPVTDQTVTAKDVVNTPINDLNINKSHIPPVLTNAIERPYGLAGLSGCASLVRAVSELDAVLGEDIDLQKARGETLSPGGIAKSVVGSFIPFEGIIREISGARSAQNRLQLAIFAGTERRSFLKGVGLERGCPYPARPATTQTGKDHAVASKPRRHR